MNSIQKTWEQTSGEVLKTPKFLKRGTKVLVKPTPTPKEVTVKGRYGPRQCYIIETKEHGLIYVNPLQLVKIAEAFAGDYSSAVTVEL